MHWDGNIPDLPPPSAEDRVDMPPPSTWKDDLAASIFGATLGFLLVWSISIGWWH